jgi:hypothetical protein
VFSKPLANLILFFTSAYCLQNATLLDWRRGDSNPHPPPCKGGALCETSALIEMPSYVDRRVLAHS